MSKARTLKFIDFIEAKRYFLQNRIFDEHAKKSSKNHPQTLPKSTKNQHQITKIAKNRSKNATSNEDAPKFAQEAPQRRPRTKKVAPDPPKGSTIKSSAAYAKPCLAAHLSWEID